MLTNKKHLFWILIGLGIADFLGAIDATGVNIALPQITRDLKLAIISAQWIPNSYLIALVATLIFFGKLGDLVGPKKLYLWGLIIFGLASLGLVFSNSFGLVVALRVIQGLGTAILYTMPMSIIVHLFKEREKAFAVTATFFAVGMLVGPVIGGLLTSLSIGSFHGWHWLFLLNVPLAIFGLIVSSRLIPTLPSQSKHRIDYLSFILLLSAIIVTIFSLSSISRWYLLLALTIFVVLYLYERKLKLPLLDFKLFADKNFTASNIVSFVAMIIFIGMSYVLTFYLQNLLGWDSTKAGLALLPVPVVTGIAASLGGRLKNWRTGAFLSSGLIFLGVLILTQITVTTSYFYGVLPGLVMLGLGSGILMTSIFSAILGSAPTEKSGSASGILNTLQQFGGLVGIAVVSSIVLDFHRSFIFLTMIAVVGIVAAFFVSKGSVNIESG